MACTSIHHDVRVHHARTAQRAERSRNSIPGGVDLLNRGKTHKQGLREVPKMAKNWQGTTFSSMMTYSFCFFGYLFKKKFDRSINDFEMHLVAKKYWMN